MGLSQSGLVKAGLGYSTLGEMEDIQIAHYDGTKGGHYTWHP